VLTYLSLSDSNGRKPYIKVLAECNESQNDKTNSKRALTGRLVREMVQLTKTFFFKVNVEDEHSEESSELNVIKKNYLFEDSVKNEEESSRYNHILIECIKNTAMVKPPPPSDRNSQND
jgi:hypothetical protein